MHESNVIRPCLATLPLFMSAAVHVRGAHQSEGPAFERRLSSVMALSCEPMVRMANLVCRI